MKQMAKRILSLLLALALAAELLPAVGLTAFAADSEDTLCQVVFADGTERSMTEAELRAEAERHLGDGDTPVTIDGVEMTWGTYQNMLAVTGLQAVLESEEVQNADMYDDAHMPYTQSLMSVFLGEPQRSGGSALTETTVKLTKKGSNSYAIDTANTSALTGSKAYTLNNYYVEDDSVENGGITVDANASDFTAFNDLCPVTLSMSWAGKVDNHATVNLTATRAEGASTSQPAVISYTIYESSGSTPVTGEITIPAGETKKELKGNDGRIALNDYKSGSSEANGLPGAAYVRYAPQSGCVLTADDSGNPVNGASCILGNDYNAQKKLNLSGQAGNIVNNIGGTFECDNPAFDGACLAINWKMSARNNINYTINLGSIISANSSIAASDRVYFRISVTNRNGHLDVSDRNASQTVTVKSGNTTLSTLSNKAGDQFNTDWMPVSQLSNGKATLDVSVGGQFNSDQYQWLGEHYLNIYVCGDGVFSAGIPAGNGTTPVFLPGDTVPIMVRTTSPAFSGSNLSVDVTYPSGNTTKTVTCSNVLGSYGDCAALFAWTMPMDCTGGTVTLKNFKTNGSAVNGFPSGGLSVNCDINYSNKLASFDTANFKTAMVNDELALVLPVRNNSNSWWEWMANEVGQDFLTNTATETAMKSVYATFGSSGEKIPIYVHGNTAAETLDFVYIKLPDGQLNAVHIWYDPAVTSTDYLGGSTNAPREAFYDDAHFFIAGLSAASVEFATTTETAEYSLSANEITDDTFPAGSDYFLLDSASVDAQGQPGLTITYNDTWAHFAGKDQTETLTDEDIVKIVPPKYEQYLKSHEDAEALTLSFAMAERNAADKKYSFIKPKYFHWVSSDPSIATVTEARPGNLDTKYATFSATVNFTGKTGDVRFALLCSNGKHPVAVQTATIRVSDSPDPYLYVPSTSSPVVTRQGYSTDVHFASNIAQRNAALAGNDDEPTSYTIQVMQGETVVHSETLTGSLNEPLSRFTIPEGVFTTIGAGNYTATVSAVYNGDDVSLGLAEGYTEESGSYVFQTDAVPIVVKAAPATVKMTLPKNLNGEASNFVMDTDSPTVEWTVTSNEAETMKWKYEVTNSAGEKLVDSATGSSGTGLSSMPKAWAIPQTPADKLKEIYTITIYVTNDEEADGWTVASTRMYVYNGSALDILIHPSDHIASGATADKAKLDNRGLLNYYLSVDGKSLDLTMTKKDGAGKLSLAELQNDVNLSTVVSLNFGDYAWGNLSDQINWSAEGVGGDNPGILYYHQASQYVDLNNLELTSVFPTGELVEQGLRDGTVKITATHAGTGQQTSVELDVDRVDNELYLFSFTPKARTEVKYKDGNGKDVSVYSNEKGELALWEQNGIDNSYPIYLKSRTNVEYDEYLENGSVQHIIEMNVGFVGVIEPGTLRSGEVDSVQHQKYPIHFHNLTTLSKVSIYLQKPDGKPLAYQSGVTVRGGAFYGGEYAPRADIYGWNEYVSGLPYIGDENLSNGLTDLHYSTKSDGSIAFYFNTQQVANGELDYSKEIEYVFEVRKEGYYPAIVKIRPYQSNSATVKLRAKPSDVDKETFTNQILLHRYVGDREKIDSLPLTGSSAKIGPNGEYSSAMVEYETFLWNRDDLIETTATGSKLKNNNLTQYFYDTGEHSTTTLGKNYPLRHNSHTSEVWLYPFSSFPIITTKLNMDAKSFGVTESGESTGDTWLARYKWTPANVFLYDNGKSVKQMDFTYGIFNGVGMIEATHSGTAMWALQSAIRGISGDMENFRLKEETKAGDWINPMIDLINGVMNNGQGFTLNPYFAATCDPTVYYVFLNMEPGTISNITDMTLDAVGMGNSTNPSDTLDSYIANTSRYGINPSYEDYEKLFDKMEKPTDEEGKPLTLDSFANRHLQGTFDYGGSGAMMLRAEYDLEHKEWHIYYLSGAVDTFLQVGYSIPFYFEGIMVRIGAEVGVDKMFAANNHYETKDIQRHDLIRQLSIGGGIECFVGTGFDCIIVYELGIVGQVKFTSSNATMTSTFAHYNPDGSNLVTTNQGNKKTLTGRIALRLKVGILFATKTFDLASTKFTIADWADNSYKNIRDVFDGKATYQDRFGRPSQKLGVANYKAMLADDGTLMLTFQRNEISTRDLMAALSVGQSIYKTFEDDESIADVALSDDGEVTLFRNANTVYYAKTSDGKAYPVVELDRETQIQEIDSVGDFGHFYLDAAGSASNLFAVWSTQTQQAATERKNTDPDASEAEAYINEPTADDLAVAMNSTEITVSHFNGTTWSQPQNLTKNSGADVVPRVAANGSKAVVMWIGGASSGMTSEGGNPLLSAANFDVESKIMFSRYNGSTWAEPAIALNTSLTGSVTGMDATLLDDGTVVAAYTIQTDATGDSDGQEIYYSIISPDNHITTNRATDNQVVDGNPKLVSLGNEAVLAWYTEATRATEQTGNSAASSTVTGDIRLLGIKANGSMDERIPESIGLDGDNEVVGTFEIAGSSLNGLTIAWLLPEDVGEDAEVSSAALHGVQLYSDTEKTVVSPAQKLAEIATAKNVSAGAFRMFVTGTQVKAMLVENDYSHGDTVTYTLDPAQFEGYDADDLTVEIPVARDKLEQIKTDNFEDTLEITDISYSEELVAPNETIPILFTVRNNGVHKISSLTLNGTSYDVTLYPRESATIRTTVTFDAPVRDYNYTISTTSDGSYPTVTGKIQFNIPKASIQEVSVVNAEGGNRTISVDLRNNNPMLPLTGSGRTLTVGLYANLDDETPLAVQNISTVNDFRLIDNSTLTIQLDTTMAAVNRAIGRAANDDIPVTGLPVFVVAEVKDNNGQTLSTSYAMENLLPLRVDENGETGVWAELIDWHQDEETGEVKANVRYSNSSLKEAELTGFTRIQVFDVDGTLIKKQFVENSSSIGGESAKETQELFGISEISVTLPEGEEAAVVRVDVTEKADSTVTPPVVKTRTVEGVTKPLLYDGSAQKLVSAGYTADGTVYYAVTPNGAPAPAEDQYSSSIPTAKDAGTYTVWYKVVGDERHNDSKPACVTTTIDKRNLTLISSTDTKVYDGTPLTNDGITAVGFADGEGATYHVTGTQLAIGTSANSFTYTMNDDTNVNNYLITQTVGQLTVTSRDAKYEIKPEAASLTVLYDGQAHTVTGLVTDTLTAANGQTYTVEGLTVEGTGTNAGEYTVNVTGTAVVRDSEGNDVSSEFGVIPTVGTLTIRKRDATLTSATDTKPYDGTPLTNGEVTVTGDGFAQGEGAVYTMTGEQTIVGTSENTFTYTLEENTLADNYNITTNNGTLTVNPRDPKYVVTLQANSDSVLYNGEPHTVSGYTIDGTESNTVDGEEVCVFTAENGSTYTLEGMVATATQTDAGTYTVNVTGIPTVKDENGNDVTDQFQVEGESGTLTIRKRQVTLTSATDSKSYNGVALTNSNITVAGDGFAQGEGADYTVTGTQTLVGDSQNTFTYALAGNTKADNYDITTEYGTLTVTRPSGSGGSGGGSSGSNGGGNGANSGGNSENSSGAFLSDGTGNSVPINTSVSGSTATIKAPSAAELDKILGADHTDATAVTFDISGLKQEISSVNLPIETVKAIEQAASDPSKDVAALQLNLTDGSVTLDAQALAAIVGQAKGDTIQLHLDCMEVGQLKTAQQAAAKELDAQAVYDVYLTSNGTPISDLKGGSVTVTVGYTRKGEQSPDDVAVWYVADDGAKTKVPSACDGKEITFTVTRFSNYVVAYGMQRPTSQLTQFTDLDPDGWYCDGVYYVLENGIMSGYGDNIFAPNDTTSRAMMAQILYNIEGKPTRKTPLEFSDVDENGWYIAAIRWAVGDGIMDGYGNGLFGPDDPLTREQLATILYRYSQKKGMDVSVGEDTNLLSYADASAVSGYAVSAMRWAVESGLITGKASGTTVCLAPADQATRAELATIMMRYQNILVTPAPTAQSALEAVAMNPFRWFVLLPTLSSAGNVSKNKLARMA